MLLDILRFVLTIIVFVALKIWEVVIFFFWRPIKILVRKWRAVLGLFGIMSFVCGWAYLLVLSANYFGIKVELAIFGNVILILIGIIFWIIYDENKVKIKRVFAENWQRARHIVNERIF
jgi:hypothetical protein